MKRTFGLLVVLLCLAPIVEAADKPQPPQPARKQQPAAGLQPTEANVRYGDHERQVLDFYQAKAARPMPLVFFIHGGGWVAGDKKGVNPGPYLKAGISVVSINYRYSWQAQQAGVKPPVKAPLEDAARALQFVRSKAREWNIDKQRIGASGGSAGACSSLWLAFHNDMAQPRSEDPIARESTRLWTAAVNGAQTSLDPQELKAWTPNSRYGGHAFGFMDPNDLKSRDQNFAEFLAKREEVLPWIKEYSPIALVTADDPPVYLLYSSPPALGQEQKDPTHSANYGVKLQEKCESVGVDCELVYPDAPNVKHKSIEDYLIASLKGPPRRPMKPTEADVRYGPHERNVLDFYRAKADRPAPLLFFIHGGGWMGGDKNGISPKPYLDAGISVVSINYRYISQAQEVSPPVKAPLHDAARALQFVRSKAQEWNIDKHRIGASGGSAGACSSLWLAFHDDMADPKSDDPIAHESTRLWCAAVNGAQTTLDPQQMKEWTPNSRYGAHAFFLLEPAQRRPTFDQFLADRDKILPWIAEYSPYALVTSDDPPVYLYYNSPPNLGKEEKDPTHTANFGLMLQKHCREKGVSCELYYPGAPDAKHTSTEAYLLDSLKGPPRRAVKPTEADVRYGKHERNMLDFYRAKADRPTPLVFFIHGGGWLQGDKNSMNPRPYLDAGISVVSINYRFITDAEGVSPPVKAPLGDAARALQFVRSKAREWNIDKPRIGASGSSAGACSSLWLAFSDDMAEPQSDDPIARESTRLCCASVAKAQTSLDPEQMKAWIPNILYGAHAFGFKGDSEHHVLPFTQFLANRDKILPWIAAYSPYALVTGDDPPVYLLYKDTPLLGREVEGPGHSANFGVKLQERCREVGVSCELYYPGIQDAKHTSIEAYLIDRLPARSG